MAGEGLGTGLLPALVGEWRLLYTSSNAMEYNQVNVAVFFIEPLSRPEMWRFLQAHLSCCRQKCSAPGQMREKRNRQSRSRRCKSTRRFVLLRGEVERLVVQVERHFLFLSTGGFVKTELQPYFWDKLLGLVCGTFFARE